MDEDSNHFASNSHVDTLADGFGPCGASMTNGDLSCGNAFKRRRFTSDDMDESFGNASRPTLSSMSTQLQSRAHDMPSAKRARTDSQTTVWNQVHAKEQIAIELQRVVDHQATEIERLKSEKSVVEQSSFKLKSEQDRITNENRILKRGITIQQERQNQAQIEIGAASRYKTQAEERIRRLEQMNLTLRYHLQASQPAVDNFMGFSPRPPDVY